MRLLKRKREVELWEECNETLSFKKLNKFDYKHIFKWFKEITIGLMRPNMRNKS